MEKITAPAQPAPKLSERVLIYAARFYDIPDPDLITARGRNTRMALARHMAVWLMKQADKLLSLPELGRIFNRDHTTIMHSLKRAEELRDEDAEFRAYTDLAVAELEAQKAARLAMPLKWSSFEADIRGAALAATNAMQELNRGGFDRDAA